MNIVREILSRWAGHPRSARPEEIRDERATPFSAEPPYRTYAEYLQHPSFHAVRAIMIKRAGGICERCHARPCTEVHHLRYPPWGTFDVPENMIAICHECHCEIHGKDD